jgi:transposase
LVVRFIGVDVHRDFCEVALVDGGRLRSAGQVASNPSELEVFACSLAPDDVVAMEATANALAIARIIEPHVARVVLADPKSVKRITGLRAKTDKIDAALLARLLAAGFLAEVWTPDEPTRVRRRLISRRMHLVRQRVREKNQVHAVLQRQLKNRPPMTDVFGVKGRVWLRDQCRLLPVDERQTVDACLRQIDFLAAEIELVDVEIAKEVLNCEDIRRLMSLPGVSGVTATAMLAAIGDVSRFPTADHLVGYLGLSPRVSQSGNEPAKHGRISKQGPGPVRGLLVEAAWHAARTTGPLRAFHQRVAARRGANIATVAVARKLVVIAFHMLRRGEEYAFGRPSLHREKLRRYELMLGAPRQQGKRLATAGRTFASVDQRRLEKELAGQAETAYRRLVTDWTATKSGAGATPGAHQKGPRRASPRGRPQAPDTCSSLRQSPAPPRKDPTQHRLPPLDFHP